MLNLKCLILLVLISFSLQDKNCLIYFERCEKAPSTITISNCINGHKEDDETTEYCDECKDGYVPSNDLKKCILIENPIQYCIDYYLDAGNELQCSKCDRNHALSSDRKTCTDVTNQIGNCISYYLDSDGKSLCDECKTDYFPSYGNKRCIEFKNCDYINNNNEENEYCEQCNNGYALSFDKMSCKPFENCEKLAEGDKKCSECYNSLFHPNAEGKCERTQCKEYVQNVCNKCYEGYYLDNDKNCKRIPIENCLEADTKVEKCISCVGGIIPDANGKCNLPSPLIKGCIEYGSDGKCTTCKSVDYERTNDGGCQLIECEEGEYKYEYCGKCKAGYFDFEDKDDKHICMGYDGSTDTSSNSSSRNKVEYALIIFILALLI